MTIKQIQIDLPVELTQDASEEQMQHVATSLMNYMGEPVHKGNAEQIQKHLRLLAGCASAMADGINQAASTTH